MTKLRREYQMSIPEPCTENWEAMLPEDKGKYCMACQKSVIDFTGMNDRQIIEILANHEGELCGRIKASQQHRNLIPAPKKIGYLKPFKYAAGLILAGIGQTAIAQEHTHTAVTIVPQTAEDLPLVQKEEGIADCSKHYISGKVVDESGAALPGCVISMVGANDKTVSDENGQFLLFVLQQQIANGVISFRISGIDGGRTFHFSPRVLPLVSTFEIPSSKNIEGIYVYGSISPLRKRHWWQFWKPKYAKH
ncbi:hypothetical protein DBR32_12735 [Taibaiella sp. KBW10]|uniref:carboxypeptidase-like regulatory domain-containing protein n=1 Tax=Taibaiella sp. KBW10 TaxID=2153357 RepID=UPI000F59F0A1|nr:carboxypeptidase-like regulatory domain-containing protein [Taibaiella sp. KBW10]RQO30425.1 hypothetical protein DBR32_12735 [Taibaiella sp. KBW10]